MAYSKSNHQKGEPIMMTRKTALAIVIVATIVVGIYLSFLSWKGVSLAVIYTDLPVGWTFEGGFDVTDPHVGIVTKVEGQAIVEIDNRPALDVYDEWLDGKVRELCEETGRPDLVRTLLILHPIYRKYTSPDGQDYFLFSHPWPKDATLKHRLS